MKNQTISMLFIIKLHVQSLFKNRTTQQRITLAILRQQMMFLMTIRLVAMVGSFARLFYAAWETKTVKKAWVESALHYPSVMVGMAPKAMRGAAFKDGARFRSAYEALRETMLITNTVGKFAALSSACDVVCYRMMSRAAADQKTALPSANYRSHFQMEMASFITWWKEGQYPAFVMYA